jgi:hypothetical protein
MLTREQKIIQKSKPNFPISVFPEREILAKLKESFEDNSISVKTELEIHKMYDMREEGGLVCEIRPKGMKDEEIKLNFLCSITHFKVKRGEPLFKELEKYRIKRIRRLARKK